METKHTPTPWKAHQASDKYYYITGKLKADDVEMIGAPVECRLAVLYDGPGADAKHIVKCVNSHEKLVEAIKDLLAAADTMNEHIDIWAYNKAIQALKSAGEI